MTAEGQMRIQAHGRQARMHIRIRPRIHPYTRRRTGYKDTHLSNVHAAAVASLIARVLAADTDRAVDGVNHHTPAKTCKHFYVRARASVIE